MIRRSTLNDLLSYHYNETGLCDSDRIQRHIDGDPAVREEYNEIISVMHSLSVVPELSPESVKKILQFC